MRIYFSLLAESITHLLLCVTRKESREHNKPPRMSQIAIERLGSEAGGCCCFCIPESQIARRPELSAPFFSGGRKANGTVFHCACYFKVRETEKWAPELFLRPPEMGHLSAGFTTPPPSSSVFLSLLGAGGFSASYKSVWETSLPSSSAQGPLSKQPKEAVFIQGRLASLGGATTGLYILKSSLLKLT